ncbi:YaaR family protein [Cytobacillus depressus]|uniref:YaaR family protein n=2 Tax=Cytobacillus depressus TaxID=1602942 RepID=A0A6L3V933_9BACI|nr:YaaR family protein [Cytobacillus depressus]KAB2336855.1 YaaR family protein [Cytobacillus depressus]
MEVNRVGKNTILNKIGSNANVAKGSITFQSVMNKNQNEQALELLQAKIKDIEEQGKKLSELRTVDSLRAYKKMVKDFLRYAVDNGLELQENFGFNQRGSTRIHRVVKEVDKKLIDLTNSVLEQESGSLDILNKVGEIKGMLINIYT